MSNEDAVPSLTDDLPPLPKPCQKGWIYDSEQMRAYARAAIAAWNRRAPTAEQAEGVQTQAARDVLAERQRQVTAEGWTPEHDDEHDEGEMASAAAAYAAHACGWNDDAVRDLWPQWSLSWLKTTTPRRDLVKAGALILAEIERLDRATPGTCFFCSEPMNSAHESDCPQAPASSTGEQA